MMIKKLKQILIIILFLIISIALILILIGGGFGEKNNPNSITNSSEIIYFSDGGVSIKEPKNTIASFTAAKINGYNGLYLKVQETSDKKLIICSEYDGKNIFDSDIIIHKSTLSELQKKKILYKDSISSESIPSFSNFTNSLKNEFITIIEVKNYNKKSFYKLTETINSIISKQKLYKRTILICPNIITALNIEYNFPEINTCVDSELNSRCNYFYKIPKNFRPDYIMCNSTDLSDEKMKWIEDHNLFSRIILKVNSPKAIPALTEFGLSNFIIDYNEETKKILTPNF